MLTPGLCWSEGGRRLDLPSLLDHDVGPQPWTDFPGCILQNDSDCTGPGLGIGEGCQASHFPQEGHAGKSGKGDPGHLAYLQRADLLSASNKTQVSIEICTAQMTPVCP